jgi:hypothetical protein
MTQDERDELTDDLLDVVLPRIEAARERDELGDIIAAGVDMIAVLLTNAPSERTAAMIKSVCELLPLLVEKNQRAFDDAPPVATGPAPTLH